MNVSRMLTVLLVAVASVGCVVSAQAEAREASGKTPKRILFVGNSYTAQIKATLMQLLTASPHKAATVEFITKGGATLQQHIERPGTLERIKSGKWDFVVLQDQSQTPALPGQHQQSFHESVDALVKAIRDSGAEPVLYMTWGRLDGDARNQHLFPDYATMQKKLTAAYRKAAERNGAILAPVGEAWSHVRQKEPDLGRALYKNDGSHPSGKGAFIAACTFLNVLFGDDLETVKIPQGITAQEAGVIKKAVLAACMKPNH